jgi:hypothetical protein
MPDPFTSSSWIDALAAREDGLMALAPPASEEIA